MPTLLYNKSPYAEFEFKGYRDFYIQMSGYTYLLAGIGLSVESTAKSLQTFDRHAWKKV